MRTISSHVIVGLTERQVDGIAYKTEIPLCTFRFVRDDELITDVFIESPASAQMISVASSEITGDNMSAISILFNQNDQIISITFQQKENGCWIFAATLKRLAEWRNMFVQGDIVYNDDFLLQYYRWLNSNDR